MSYFLVKPIAPVDLVAGEAAPFALKLNAEKVLESAIDAGSWLARIFDWRATGELSLRAAAYLTGYVIQQNGLHGNGPIWSRLALVDWLGRVRADNLDPACINRLLRDLDTLYHQAQTQGAPTLAELARYAESRRRATLNICGAVVAPFAPIYTRAVEALAIFYGA